MASVLLCACWLVCTRSCELFQPHGVLVPGGGAEHVAVCGCVWVPCPRDTSWGASCRFLLGLHLCRWTPERKLPGPQSRTRPSMLDFWHETGGTAPLTSLLFKFSVGSVSAEVELKLEESHQPLAVLLPSQPASRALTPLKAFE